MSVWLNERGLCARLFLGLMQRFLSTGGLPAASQWRKNFIIKLYRSLVLRLSGHRAKYILITCRLNYHS